jgi:hypothetical protein
LSGTVLPYERKPESEQAIATSAFLAERMQLEPGEIAALLAGASPASDILDSAVAEATLTMASALADTLVRAFFDGGARRCLALAAAHAPVDPAELEVVWQIHGGAGRAHFIARLVSGGFGLLTRLKDEWLWVQGDRDTVLATVPEELFESACAALLAPDPIA